MEPIFVRSRSGSGSIDMAAGLVATSVATWCMVVYDAWMMMESMFKRPLLRGAGALVLALAAAFVQLPVAAQAVPQLSAQQQQMLNALPPAQREALLRRFLGQQSGNEGTLGKVPEESPALPEITVKSPRAPQVLTLDAEDTVLLVLGIASEMVAKEELAELKDRVNERNPFRLDKGGRLRLPGVPEIALAGLTEAQALIRLQAEPALAAFDIRFYLLPVDDPYGPRLKPFGYDLFVTDPGRFAIGKSLPVPRQYAVGPGDTVYVQFYGTTNGQYAVPIDRDGTLNLPELGPLRAAGLTFDGLREEVRLRVSRQLIGTEVSVTLGELRSVRVFLAGDVLQPGAYQVSAFATITNVLALGGGVADAGSLRNIELKRGGRVVSSLDLYDLLLDGDSSKDGRVASGDVVFVPPVGPRVTVAGEVRRPAIYEFRRDLTVAAAIKLAGGSLPSALLSNVRIHRSLPESGLNIIEIDLVSPSRAAFAIEAGDRIVVEGESEQLDKAVTLTGHVYRPGLRQWRSGLRLSDVLNSPKDLKPEADTRYVLIKRRRIPNGPIEVLSADLQAIWDGTSHRQDMELLSRDEIIVFSTTDSRDVYLNPILDLLRLQSAADAPTAVARIEGQVKQPGVYPLEAGMTVADLIRAGGGLSESAYRQSAELTRYSNDGNGPRESELLDVTLSGIDGRGGPTGLELQAFDYLNVKEVPYWGAESFVEISGAVTFPGRYSVARGETLSSVLQRAGGLTATSFAVGSVFTREALRKRERKQLEELAARIESDLATLALSNPSQVDAISIGQSLLRQIRTTEPTGRLVIDMDSIVAGDTAKDVLVRDGDALFVPQRSQEVTVIGEVQYATSHLWREGPDREDYILHSGGITAKADRKRIYVVRASGEVVVANRSRFYAKSGGGEIRAGDTIVVPLKTDRVAALVLWSSATQILYNLAIAAAAVGSF